MTHETINDDLVRIECASCHLTSSPVSFLSFDLGHKMHITLCITCHTLATHSRKAAA